MTGRTARHRLLGLAALFLLSACGGPGAPAAVAMSPGPSTSAALPPASPSATPPVTPAATVAVTPVPATPPPSPRGTAAAPRPPATPRPRTPAPAPAPAATLGGCPLFPADNPWNQDVSRAPLDPNSQRYVARVDSFRGFLHADFGSDPSYGIPYVVVAGSQPFVPITFTAYGDESDPGPYPVPPNAPVESGGDAHVLVADTGNCHLYEMYAARRTASGWSCDSGAVFDLRSDRLRPDTWTSADAAGLPILPGLVRYDEVASGSIHHALRFTVNETQNGFIHPATHQAGTANASDPPMGARFRLSSSFDLSRYHGQALVVLRALQTYGMLVADNGSSWFISGATDPRWNDPDLDQLKSVPGSAFEVVATGPIQRG